MESEANHEKCLLLSDAMNGQNIYMKYLAFYEYCFKTDSGNQDVSIFYKITHPGIVDKSISKKTFFAQAAACLHLYAILYL